jgi:hypothetical protein
MRLSALAIGTALAAAVWAGPASAHHPLAPAFVCEHAAVSNPPGQEPGATPHSDQSTLRALQATGILTLTPTGPVFDLTHPASKLTTFNPFTGAATSDHPAILNCQRA